MKNASRPGAARRCLSGRGAVSERLGLAVALLPDAPVLLLDEPTAALDPDGLCAFYGVIERRRDRGQTVLFSSHHMGDVERLADRFLVLSGGRLVSSLSAAELTKELAERGVMKITLDRLPEHLLDAVRPLAPRTVWAGGQLVVAAPPAARMAVLDVVRGSGAEIRGLTADEARLDSFYRELIGGRT